MSAERGRKWRRSEPARFWTASRARAETVAPETPRCERYLIRVRVRARVRVRVGVRARVRVWAMARARV